MFEDCPPSATVAINEPSNRLIKEGREIFKLGLGQSPFPVPDIIVEALKSNAHKKDYLPGYAFGRPPEELTARLAYINFDGKKALEAADKISADEPLDDNFLEKYCKGPIVAIERLCEWVNSR